MISTVLLLITSFFLFLKLVTSIACSLKDLQDFFMQSLPLYTSCIFFMFLNENIAIIEKSDGIFLPTFAVDEFSRQFLHPSNFSIRHSRSA